MEIKKLTFKDLDYYHNNIPMMKSGDKKVIFTSKTEYNFVETNPYHIDMTKEESTSLWKEILSEENTEILIVKDGDIPVAGVITVTHSPKCNMLKGDMSNAVLWDIRVHPDYQGKGLATKLMNKSLAFAKEKNCKRLLIETQDNNPKAIRFYLKQGATLLHTNKDVYPKELNEIQYIFKIKL